MVPAHRLIGELVKNRKGGGVSHSVEVMSLRLAIAIRSGGSEFADVHD